MGEFGKLNFSVSFNRTSAFPIEANGYFETLTAAQEAAATAVEVGSAESTYYIGETLTVVEGNKAKTYIIQPDKSLKENGSELKINEEDLILNSENKLQFANRPYNVSNFSGKGLKILRKNIQEGKNILTQEMINEPNTVYEIRYDFDLNGTTINIPEGCILNFKNGSIKNGTINGNNTFVNGYYKNYLTVTYSQLYDLKGNDIFAKTEGTFAEKPLEAKGLCIGFPYFCTDLYSFGGDTGKMIFHKGGDIWIDCSGAVVNENYYQSKWMQVDENGDVFDTEGNPLEPVFPGEDVWDVIE